MDDKIFEAIESLKKQIEERDMILERNNKIIITILGIIVGMLGASLFVLL